MLKIEERTHFHKECHYSVNWGALDYRLCSRCIRLTLCRTPPWNSGKFPHVNKILVQLLNMGNVCFTLNDIGITPQILLLTSQRHHSWCLLPLSRRPLGTELNSLEIAFSLRPCKSMNNMVISILLPWVIFLFLNEESDIRHFCSPDREHISVSLSGPGELSSLSLKERKRTTCKNSLKKLIEKCLFSTLQTNKWIDHGTNSSLLLL